MPLTRQHETSLGGLISAKAALSVLYTEPLQQAPEDFQSWFPGVLGSVSRHVRLAQQNSCVKPPSGAGVFAFARFRVQPAVSSHWKAVPTRSKFPQVLAGLACEQQHKWCETYQTAEWLCCLGLSMMVLESTVMCCTTSTVPVADNVAMAP